MLCTQTFGLSSGEFGELEEPFPPNENAEDGNFWAADRLPTQTVLPVLEVIIIVQPSKTLPLAQEVLLLAAASVLLNPSCPVGQKHSGQEPLNT